MVFRDVERASVLLSSQPIEDLLYLWFRPLARRIDGAPRCFVPVPQRAIASTGICARPTNAVRAPGLLRVPRRLGEMACGPRRIALFENLAPHSCEFPLSPCRSWGAAKEFQPAAPCLGQWQ